MNRRNFLKNSISAGCLLGLTPSLLASAKTSAFKEQTYVEALYYTKTPRGLKCLLCPKECTIFENRPGHCMVRVSKNNKLVSLNYGKPCYVNTVNPESFSLFHYFPGSSTLVIGAAGCNLSCMNCPVSHVSQKSPDEVTTQNLSPEEVIATCKEKNIQTLVFGYSEPVVFYEYMLASAKLAKQNNINTVLSSSGYISETPMQELCKYLDAAIIDIKAFSDTSYHKLSGGSIFPVFETLKTIRESKIWLEISHKIVPGYTDNLDLTKAMCKWMMENGYQDVPIHFNTFKPVYRLSQTAPTPIESIKNAIDAAKTAGLHYVYTNHPEIKSGTITYCPTCKKPLIDRSDNKLKINKFTQNQCTNCKTLIAGVWM